VVLIRLVLCIRVPEYGHFGSLVSIILRILPIQWQNSLPCGRAGAMHRRRSRRHHVAEQSVSEVATLVGGTTNLPDSLDCPKKTVVPFLLMHLYLSLRPYQCFRNIQPGEMWGNLYDIEWVCYQRCNRSCGCCRKAVHKRSAHAGTRRN